VSRKHSGGFSVVGEFTLQGTPIYIAPNLFEGQYYSEKCDVWSAGVTMHELLTGTNYFEEAKKKNWNFLTNLHKQMENNPVRLSGEFS
jgi:serine/threonine protein kinase